MLTYQGIDALSGFRRHKLLAKLRQVDPHIQSVTGEYIHLVDAKGQLADKADQQLRQLLTYGTTFTAKHRGKLFLVTPRIGTISPWSSKATDIAQNCSLSAVKRIERATAYYIQSGKP